MSKVRGDKTIMNENTKPKCPKCNSDYIGRLTIDTSFSEQQHIHRCLNCYELFSEVYFVNCCKYGARYIEYDEVTGRFQMVATKEIRFVDIKFCPWCGVSCPTNDPILGEGTKQ